MKSKILTLILILISISIIKIHSATIVWVGGNNNNEWNQVVNWSPMIVPGINDSVVIPNSWTGEITITGANASSKSISYNGTGFNIYIDSGWEFLLAGDLNINGNSKIYGLGGIEIIGNNICNLNYSDSTDILVSHINIKSTSDAHLNNDLFMPFGKINVYSGNFITNGYDVLVNSIIVADGTANRILNIENSEVTTNMMSLSIRNNGDLFASNSIVNNNLMIVTNDNVNFNIINSANKSVISTTVNDVVFSVSQLNAQGDISILGSTVQTNQAFSITQFNILHAPAIIRLTPEPYVAGYYFYTIQSPNTCNEVLFTDGFEVDYNQVVFNIVGAAHLHKASASNIRVASGTFIIDEGDDIGNNNGLTFSQTNSTNYYWIGGKGEWNDPNHWSLSSGGMSSGCIPGLKDNAIFDNASGFLNNDTVFISTHTFCKDLNSALLTINKPTLSQSNGAKETLNISGNINLSGFNSYNVYYPIFMWNKNNVGIKTSGNVLLDDVYLLNKGICQLQDSINLLDGQKNIYQLLGGLSTNGFEVTISALISKGSKVPASTRSLALYNSTIHIGHPTLSCGGTLIYSDNLALNAGTSNFIFDYVNNSNGEFKIEGTEHLQFYNVKFLNKVGTPQVTFNHKSTFNKIHFEGNGTFWTGSFAITPEISGTDTLVISGNYRYEIEQGTILNVRKQIIQQHTSCNEISFVTSTSLANHAYLHTNGNAPLHLANTWIENIEAVGANIPFIVNNGINGGYNIGLSFLTFNNLRVFYWNGEGVTSHWSEGRNWNINAAPHLLSNDDNPILYNINGCIPGFNDSVVFHINSFPVRDTISIDENINFRGMDWNPGTGNGHKLSGNNQFTMNNYGGIRFDTNLEEIFAGDIYFRSPYNREVTFNDVSYKGTMIFYQLGKSNLMDNMVCEGYSIKFLAGSFTSNNNLIKTNHFFIHHSVAPVNNNNIIRFGTSTLEITGAFSNQFYDHVSQLYADSSIINFMGPNSSFIIDGNAPSINYGHVNYTIPNGDVTLNSNYYSGIGIPHFKYVNFESSARIVGDNSMDTVILAEGKDYFIGATETQFINDLLYSKGSPCYRTSIQSTVPGTRAYIQNSNCHLLVEHARLRDIEGILGNCGANNYLVGVGGEDLGNNQNWFFIPGNPIQGLGVDTLLTCNSLPYHQTTLGFGRFDTLIWSNGATTNDLWIVGDTTISATVIYSPICIVDDIRNFGFKSYIAQEALIQSVTCNGLNNGFIKLNMIDVDSNYNQTWIYPDNTSHNKSYILNNLAPGTYTSIVSVPGFENVCSDTTQFNILEPEKLIVTLDTTILGKCSDPDGTIMITASGGVGNYSYTWSDQQTTEDNLHAFGGFNEVQVSDTNNCMAILSVNLLCIEHINIPELITPNGDGLSDEWEIIDLLRLYPDNEVKILNRWGNLVYSKKAYSNDFTGHPNTNTTLFGGLLPSGTYFYVIHLGEKYKPLTGYVELVY